MKKVFVCSPLRGNVGKNIEKAKGYCREIALKGNIPIAPHVYFTQFLNEEDENERNLGIKQGIELLDICDEMNVYGDKITDGMRQEIERFRGKANYFPNV